MGRLDEMDIECLEKCNCKHKRNPKVEKNRDDVLAP